MPDRRLMERTMADMGKLLEGRNFETMEEVNAFLQSAMANGGIAHPAPTTPLERAQDLVYEAYDADGKRRVELARKALALSPDCADAYGLLAEEAGSDLLQVRDLFRQGVEAGERALGPAAFVEGAGHFWGALATRPYMRVRLGLAQVLWVLGQSEEAIGHYEELLRLNPGDNQGVRYLLASALLDDRRHDRLRELLDEYDGDATAAWAYTAALLQYRLEGPSAMAEKLLDAAVETNPHVPFWMVSREGPSDVPDVVGFGDPAEASSYVAESRSVWRQSEGAILWMAERSQARPQKGRAGKKVGRDRP
jgi:tetratricopeptide (TPR) repeat protein